MKLVPGYPGILCQDTQVRRGTRVHGYPCANTMYPGKHTPGTVLVPGYPGYPGCPGTNVPWVSSPRATIQDHDAECSCGHWCESESLMGLPPSPHHTTCRLPSPPAGSPELSELSVRALTVTRKQPSKALAGCTACERRSHSRCCFTLKLPG